MERSLLLLNQMPRDRARQRFDERKYGQLLARTAPAVIRNEADLKRVEEEIAKLLRKGDDLAPEEDRLLDLLSALVERYEDETEDFPPSPPNRILHFLMKQNDLRQADLAPIFGSSGRVSEVVNGKRGISKAQAKALGEFFKVSPELFIFPPRWILHPKPAGLDGEEIETVC